VTCRPSLYGNYVKFITPSNWIVVDEVEVYGYFISSETDEGIYVQEVGACELANGVTIDTSLKTTVLYYA